MLEVITRLIIVLQNNQNPTWLERIEDALGSNNPIEKGQHTGRSPMKKVQPGVHPEKDGSKWPNTNAAEWRPDAAFTDKQTKTTNGRKSCNWINLEKSNGSLTDNTQGRPACTYGLWSLG